MSHYTHRNGEVPTSKGSETDLLYHRRTERTDEYTHRAPFYGTWDLPDDNIQVQAIRKIKAGTVTTSGPSIRLTLNRVPPHSAYHDRPPNPVLEDQPTDFTLKDSGLIPVDITRLKREFTETTGVDDHQTVIDTTDERTAVGDMHFALRISVRPWQMPKRAQGDKASNSGTCGTTSRGGTQASAVAQVPFNDHHLEDTIDIEIPLAHAEDFFGPREVDNETYYNGHWCTNSLS